MSLPAPLSASPPIVLLRRHLGAALPSMKAWAGLGAVPAGRYRSAFPPRLRIGRISILILALLWLAAGLHAIGSTTGIVRIVGHDTAPSVAAAERIRTGLAGANADFALAILSGEGADGVFLPAMHRELRAVRGAIVAAAGNVTYGEEERGPIGTVLQGLGDYEQLIGRALASQGATRSDMAFQADDLLHWTVLPAAATLERVNADHLSEDYVSFLGHHVLPWWVVAATALLAALIAVQADMARTARRILNPALAVATLLIVGTTAFVAVRITAAQSDLRVAKADAFDSVYALSSADAIATDFDAGQSFFLLAEGDAARQARYAEVDATSAQRLLRMDTVSAASAVRNSQGFYGDNGFIGDALANVTFQGERQAAVNLVNAWGDMVRSDTTLRAAETRGQHASAVSSKTTDAPGTARRVFAQFDSALDKVLAINRNAFEASIAAAEGDTGPLMPVLLGAVVMSVAAAWYGIRRRLDDYRF